MNKDLLYYDPSNLSLADSLSDISFCINNGVEMIKICANGDFFVKGKKVTEDIDVYNGFVNFLKESGHYG